MSATGCNEHKEQPQRGCVECGAATKTMTIEEMMLRLAARGLVPCEHQLSVWRYVNDGTWGAGIDTQNPQYNIEVYGDSLRDVLEALMRATNRAADLTMNAGLKHSPEGE